MFNMNERVYNQQLQSEAGIVLSKEQLAILADIGDRVDSHLDCDEDPAAQASFMSNLSSYDSDVLSRKAHRNKPTLYDGSVISRKNDAIFVTDEEDTLILEELNKLSEDFGKHFVSQKELSAEQALWLQTSNPNTEPSENSLVKIKAPSKLPKRITPDAITKGSWGFKQNKVVFLNEIIPFLKTLKDIFNVFDKHLLNEITEVKTVFNQMEAVVAQCSVDMKCFEIKEKELFLENDRVLECIICQDVVNNVMHADVKSDYVLPVQNTFLDDNIALDMLKMDNNHLMELLDVVFVGLQQEVLQLPRQCT
ncbi:hypothetical protein Tco_1014721 [Tanacetum coccineum]